MLVNERYVAWYEERPKKGRPMRITPVLTAVLSTLVVAGPVCADGLSDPLPEVQVTPVATAPTYSWTGATVGVQLSYGDLSTSGPALDGGGALLGLRATYDWQTDRVIYGVGLQYDTADIDLDGAAAVDSVLRLSGRVGVDSGRNFLYGTAGFARATTEAGTADVGASDGYFLGAGYEVFVSDDTTIGSELLYHRFEDFENLPTLEADATTLGVSVNFRF